MKISIDEKICLKHKMTLEEFLLALTFRYVSDYKGVFNNLLNREVLVKKGSSYLITQNWSDVLDEIIADSSDEPTRSDEEYLKLAKEMRALFPKGRMVDNTGRETPYYYRCNDSEVVKSLKRFFTQRGNFTDEEILNATKRYVASFNGNYSGMRLIKYFIIKNAVKKNEEGTGYVDQISDLETYLSNKDEEGGVEVNNSSDWLLNARN